MLLITVHRQAKFAQSTILCFQYLGFHDHTFNRAKLENYVIIPGFHGQALHGQAAEFSCPGFHDKQQNSLSMHCNAHTQHPNNPSLSRFEVYPTAQTFCAKPDPLYSTQYSDLFVTYTDGFNMHTGQPNPHSMIIEYISGRNSILSGNLFSEVIIPTPVPAYIRLPEYYTADHSRPPTPNFADYLLRVDGITIYDPQNDPRFPILAELYIANNDLLSQKSKETELKRLQTPNLELTFEVKVKFQGLNTHPIFHVSKIKHKTSPATFEVVHNEFERDLTQPTITYDKIIIICNPYSGLKYTSSF